MELYRKSLLTLLYWVVTFDAEMSFDKHLRCFQSCSSEALYLGNSLLFWDICSSFVIRFLEYCSAVWCSAADSHLTLLEELSEVPVFFLAGGVLEFNLAPWRSVAVLCMLFKIKSTPMYPLNGALPLPYVPALVTRGTLAARRHSFAPPRCRTFQCCRTSQYFRTFVPPLSISRNVFIDHACLMVWVLRTEPMPSC